jgi:hypothetical protein
MPDAAPEKSLEAFSNYVVTHCMTCAAGWTRTGDRGEVAIYCLLNREPVWTKLAACDRFEAREEAASPPLVEQPVT